MRFIFLTDGEKICSNSRFVLVQKTCFLKAGDSNQCKSGDVHCRCESFKAPSIKSGIQECLIKECNIQDGTQAQSAASIMCSCLVPSPTEVPEITFPDSQSAQDPPPTTTTESPSPSPSSTGHRHPHFHKLMEKVPLFNAFKGVAHGFFHHDS